MTTSNASTPAGQAKPKPTVIDRRSADPNHDVVTVSGGSGAYRRRPCGGCPWVVDNTGDFPPEAFRLSARTSYDMAEETFACHEAGTDRPSVCAGFLLRGAEHSMGVRLKQMRRELDIDEVAEDDRELHRDYVEMAVANGVDPDDPVLARSRRGSTYLRAVEAGEVE